MACKRFEPMPAALVTRKRIDQRLKVVTVASAAVKRIGQHFADIVAGLNVVRSGDSACGCFDRGQLLGRRHRDARGGRYRCSVSMSKGMSVGPVQELGNRMTL